MSRFQVLRDGAEIACFIAIAVMFYLAINNGSVLPIEGVTP